MRARFNALSCVLSDWEFENAAIFAVYPSARQLSTKVRATVDFLAKHLKDPPSWDQLLVGVTGFTQGFRNP